MHLNDWFVGLGFLAVVSVGAAVGCSDRAGNCALNLEHQRADGTCVEGFASISSSSSGGHDGGHGNCNPAAGAVDESCGVFVSASAPSGGTGTKTSPYNSLQTAISNASGQYVYACASTPFSEAVMIAAPVQLYGGFADCTTENGWSWSQNARTALDGPADMVAVTIAMGAATTTIEGFSITAASPSNLTMGGSSIAVAVDKIAATLDHCDVKASDAAAGADGQAPSGPATAGASAPSMMVSNACVATNQVFGGVPGQTTCADGTTAGGAGGAGGITGTASGDGQQGANGTPLPSPNPTMAGLGGVGQTDPIDPTKACKDATKGLSGTPGGAGPGGAASGDSLSLDGITNGNLTDGKPGSRGQGGGGGGGAMSGMFCMAGAMMVDGVGASGGGGGAGGCGGGGGGGGKAGGSSIAIVSLGTRLTLTSVTLTTGNGGHGGKGSVGQTGGSPGAGAFGGLSSGIVPSAAGCAGGNGGTGGPGGSGGGGRGGHSIGIAYVTAPAPAPTIMTFTPGTPGGGGTPGSGAPTSSNGATGSAGQCFDFGTGKACGA
jgi:hypothetical protein